MLTLREPSSDRTAGSVCCVGTFDGVHLGHQSIIKLARAIAGRHRCGIVTFDPAPLTVLQDIKSYQLTTREEKETILRDMGVDFVYYFRFTKAFSRLSPSAFVRRLERCIRPSAIVVGDNFHYGAQHRGTAVDLRQEATGRFEVHIAPRIVREGLISSTRIRELLLLGHTGAANRLLGRPYQITGRVVRGRGKGRRLGFPTINVAVDPQKLLPLDGVYYGTATAEQRVIPGALCCRGRRVEFHLIGFRGSWYGRFVEIQVGQRLRGIQHFKSEFLLARAIRHDVARAGRLAREHHQLRPIEKR